MNSRLQVRDDMPKGVAGDRYRLSAQIGSGRLGLIYAATDAGAAGLASERRVAVQIVDRHLAADTSYIEKLRRGYALLGTRHHPNIVRTLDFRSSDGACFVVTELLEGVSARFVLKDSGTVPLDEAVPIVRALGDALQFLHAKSITHGNLSPENVFVTVDYDVKLLDVVPDRSGIQSPRDDPSPDRIGVSVGDPREDVFGLACLVYELLAGRAPFFNACTDVEARRAGLTPRPLDMLTGEQWQALARGMALNPDRRTPSVAALLDEFGVTGTERLGPAEQQAPAVPPSGGSPGSPASENASGMAVGMQAAAGTPLRATREDSLQPGPPQESARRRRGITLRTTAMTAAALTAGLAAYFGPWFSGGDRDSAPPTVLLAGSRVAPAVADPDLETTATPEPQRIQRVEPSATSEPAVGTGLAPPAVPPAVDTPQTQVRAETETRDARMSGDEPESLFAEPPPIASGDAAASEEEPESGDLTAFTPKDVRLVSRENDVFVPVVIERAGPLEVREPLSWWIESRSAIAGEDFVNLGESTVTFAADEAVRTVYVALVNDGIAEQVEFFLVHIGHRNPQTGALESLASSRIEIIDDD